MKTLCIDARLWGISHTGPGRYTENLIANLIPDSKTKIVLIVSPEQEFEISLKSFPKYIAHFHPYSPFSQLEMAYLLYLIQPDLFHATHFTVPVFWFGKTIVTIHDLIKHYSTGRETTTREPWIYWLKYLGYRFIMWNAIFRSRHIIVPSIYWKQELIRLYHLPESKITVTYEAVALNFLTGKPSHFIPPVKRPFVVHTGNLYPHKNIPVLISAARLLHGKINIALVCSRSIFANRLPLSPHVHYLGRLSDSDLLATYRQAAAYVFPSLIEGFGLPGLEAMSAGCPVIAASASCLPEIYGDAALYFDPHSPRDLADKITLLLSDSRMRRSLIIKGFRQVKKYSWAKMSQQTWQIYQQQLL